MNTIGERIKELMLKNNIKAPTLANRIGITKGSIYKYINNTSIPKGNNVINLAKELNTSVDFIIFGHEEYKDLIEEQLLEAFRQLTHENKVIAAGEIMKLLTMQELTEKKD